MKQYIPKSDVVKEIEKLINEIYAGRPFDALSSEQQTALWYLRSLMSSIIALKVKEEADLEKEIDKEWNKCEPIDEGMGLEIASIEHEQFDNIAKHFFELGLRMRESE
jgi:hypothetical protein